jgi:hypothetical protein
MVWDLELFGFPEIRDAMLEKAPRATAAAEDEGEGVEWTTVAGKGVMAGDERPLEGGESVCTGGVDWTDGGGWTYLSIKNFSFERCPLLKANRYPKLRKSFSTNTMKPLLAHSIVGYLQKYDNTDPDRFDLILPID